MDGGARLISVDWTSDGRREDGDCDNGFCVTSDSCVGLRESSEHLSNGQEAQNITIAGFVLEYNRALAVLVMTRVRAAV